MIGLPVEGMIAVAIAQIASCGAMLWALHLRLRFFRDVFWTRLDRQDLWVAGRVVGARKVSSALPGQRKGRYGRRPRSAKGRRPAARPNRDCD